MSKIFPTSFIHDEATKQLTGFIGSDGKEQFFGGQKAIGANFGRRLGAIGTSITAYNVYKPGTEVSFTSNGIISALQARWGNRFYIDPNMVFGYSGATTDIVINNFAATIAKNYNNLDWVWVESNPNDATNSINPAVTVANIIDMVTRCTDQGIKVILQLPMPRSFAGDTAAIRNRTISQRERLMDWASNNPRNVYVLDFWRDLQDPASATSADITTPIRVLQDGLHPSIGGAFSRCARRAEAVLGSFVPPRPIVMAGAADVYDATNNPYGNLLPNAAFLTATGGTATNVNGTLPSSYLGIKRAGSFLTTEVVFSNVAGTAGYDGNITARTLAAVNIASGKTSNEVFGFKLSTNLSTNFAIGDKVFAYCEIDLDTVANMKNHVLKATEYVGGSPSMAYGAGGSQLASSDFLYPETQKHYLRTPDFIIGATNGGTTNGLNLEYQPSFDASTGNATANIYISAIQLRRVAY